MASHDFDVLIVGSGLAGLSAALHLAPTHRVAVITKRQLQDGAIAWAQRASRNSRRDRRASISSTVMAYS